MNTWKLSYNKFDPENENLREALCTLGNGYFGTRGATPETIASRVHYPGTYIAGLYNTLPTDMAGKTIYNEDFVNCPNWLWFNYRINESRWFNRLKVKILSWKMELDMQKGILTRRIRWQDDRGRITKVENKRIVSMADPHLAAMQMTITPENYSGKITVRSGIDGLIINSGVERYRQLNSKHLEPVARGSFGDDGLYLQVQTNQSAIQITQAVRHLIYHNGQRITPKLKPIMQVKERAIDEFAVQLDQGEKLTVEKFVSIYTSRDQGVDDHYTRAVEDVSRVESFKHALKPHVAKWKALWSRFDIQIEGDDFVQKVLRLHAFHLLQSASSYNEDIDAGIPARGLHGEAYRGHIFWDEMYIFPFYNINAPEITRALLMYRYRRLGKAKEYAAEHGYKGAMFPWQSASAGDETTQILHLNPMSGVWGPDNSSRQRHVSIAVAYNVWSYYYTSGDRDFMDRYGAEMMMEISQFWSTIACKNKDLDRYVIEGVMGPDEFHEHLPGAEEAGLKNNAYTNVMAVWVIKRTLELLSTMSEEERSALMYKCEIKEDDLARWQEITERMYIPFDKETGLIHQFDGYMDLEELDWEGYQEKYENIHRVDRILKAEGLSPDGYKVAKQADVLMLFYVLNYRELEQVFGDLGYKFDRSVMQANYDYYIERTSHGSTLSKVVHTYIAQRLGSKEEAMLLYKEALESDIHDVQGGTTQEGIHAGVMAGTCDLALRCYAGLAVLEDRIALNPELPKEWKSMNFQVGYKNIWFRVQLTRRTVKVTAEPLEHYSLQTFARIPFEVNKNLYMLEPGKEVKVKLS